MLEDGMGAFEVGDWLGFRSAVVRGRWEDAVRLRPRVMSRSARMGEALVIREANARTGHGDLSGARRALDALLDRGGRDPLVWYASGQAYEKAGSPDQAEECYRRGLAAEEKTIWAAGRYYLGVLYFKEDRWLRVIETLEGLANRPLPPHIEGRIGSELSRLADWPGGLVLLGYAYEHTGRTAEAKALYQRLLRAGAGSRGWQVNRTLVALAALEGREGAIPEAMQHFASALDLTFGYPASFREQYQADTWKQLLEVVGNRGNLGGAARLLLAATRTVEVMPSSPGAWLVLALAGAATCKDDVADDAYQGAVALDPGVRPFRERLQVARSKPPWTSCRTQ